MKNSRFRLIVITLSKNLLPILLLYFYIFKIFLKRDSGINFFFDNNFTLKIR